MSAKYFSFDGMDDTMPDLIAFDLDYTLWPGWIDTHYTGPLRRPSPNSLNYLLDKNDKRLSLYPSVSRILHRLQESQISIAATSRTNAPEVTRDALALLLVPPPKERPRERPQRAIDFFESLEIYGEPKRVHFSELHKKTQIPYSMMLFFAGDPSEHLSNSDVARFGVTFVPINPKYGLTDAVLEDGIREWRRNRRERAVRTGDDEDAGRSESTNSESDGSGDTW